MDIDKAFEADNGFLITDGPFYTGGATSPIGIDLPTKALYLQETPGGVLLWLKFDTGVNDWRQLSAQDVPFDPTGLLNLLPSDNTVQLAVTSLGNQSVGDLTEAENFTSPSAESTTSNGWVSKAGFPILTDAIKTAGSFSIRWSSIVGQTTKNKNFGIRFRWRAEGGTWADLSSVDTLTMTRNEDQIMQSGFKEVQLPTDTKVELDAQYGQTTQGGSALFENVDMEIRRIGD